MTYCPECGFYYKGSCDVCDDGEIQDQTLASAADADTGPPSPDGWILLVLSIYLWGVLAYYMHMDGITLGYLVPYLAVLGLYSLSINREMRFIHEYAETDGWLPNIHTWHGFAAVVVATGGLFALVLTPYYLYKRRRHVTVPDDA